MFNPNFSADFWYGLQPILYIFCIVIIIYNLIKTIQKGKIEEIIIQLIIGSLILYIIKKPEILLKLGNFIITILAKLGSEIFKYE